MRPKGGAMKNKPDKVFEKYKDYDFADAKTVAETPHLLKLQAQAGIKTRITMRVDSDVIAAFKAHAKEQGGSYQTLMNDALRQFAQGLTLSDVLRDAVRETMVKYLDKSTRGKSNKTGR